MPRGIYTRIKKLIFSEEHKRKISVALVGIKRSEETKKKMTGKKMAEETKKKLSDSHKGYKYPEGRIHWAKGKFQSDESNKKRSNALKGRKPYEMSDEIRRKMSSSRKGKIPIEESNIKRSASLLGRIPWNTGKLLTEEHRRKVSESLKGKKCSEEKKRKISRSLKGHPVSKETLKKIFNLTKPNKAEQELFRLVENIFPDEYKLNVKGEILILGGKIPDIVNVNGRKRLIELYGDFYHKGDDPQKRINYFKQFGWKTLVIWGHELKDIDLLKAKLQAFV